MYLKKKHHPRVSTALSSGAGAPTEASLARSSAGQKGDWEILILRNLEFLDRNELGQEIDQSPWSYLRDFRHETAARLLLETEISLLEIGRLVGYSSPSSFRQSLHRFLGMSASQYRRRAPRILERSGPAPEGVETEEVWERMLAGKLTDDEAVALDAYLERLTPETDAKPVDSEAERWRKLRETLADGFADGLRHLVDFADRRRLVRDAIWFPDDTFFQTLSRQSREVAADRIACHGPEDPLERGVEWALLGIDSLAANGLLDSAPALASLAWARLALARWRAGDLAGAEKDFERSARDAGREGRSHSPPHEQAESVRAAAAWHWHQGRWRQALAFAHGAVAAQREVRSGVDAGRDLARALELRAEVGAAVADLESATAAERLEALRDAARDLDEALDQLAPQDRDAAADLRMRLLVLIGTRAELAAALPALRQASTADVEDPRLMWFEGHATGDSEPLLRQARDGFTALDDPLWLARVTLDLARLCLARDRADEASTLTSELIVKLGVQITSPDDLAALKAVGRSAAPMPQVTPDDLDRAEQILKREEWYRRASRALQLAADF